MVNIKDCPIIKVKKLTAVPFIIFNGRKVMSVCKETNPNAKPVKPTDRIITLRKQSHLFNSAVPMHDNDNDYYIINHRTTTGEIVVLYCKRDTGKHLSLQSEQGTGYGATIKHLCFNLDDSKPINKNETKENIIKINAPNLIMHEVSFTSNTTNKFCKYHISFNTKTNMVYAVRNVMVSHSGFYSMLNGKNIDLYTYDELIKEIKKHHRKRKIDIKKLCP